MVPQLKIKFRNIADFGVELRLVARNSAILIGCHNCQFWRFLTYKNTRINSSKVFLYENARTIGSGVSILIFFYIKAPELLVLVFLF